MAKTEFATDNEFVIRLRASERQRLRKEKKNGKTYTQVVMPIAAGKRKPLRVAPLKHDPWGIVRIFPTSKEHDLLLEEAARRGISVSRLLRAMIFQQPEAETTPVAAGVGQFKIRLDAEMLAMLDALRKDERFEHLAISPERTALVEISRVLMADALKQQR